MRPHHRTSAACSLAAPASAAPVRRMLALLLVIVMVAGAASSAVPATAHAEAPGAQRHSGPAHGSGPPDKGVPSGFEEVIVLGVGADPDEAGIMVGEEVEPWGPSSFAIDESGRFHIVDGVNRRILVIDPADGKKQVVEWSDPVICPVDIEIADGRTFVLDLPAQPPAVHEIDVQGRALSTWEIPDSYLEHGVTAFDVTVGRNRAPEIGLELAGAWQVPLTGPGSSGTKRLPLTVDGDVVRMPASAAPDFAIRRSQSRRAAVIDKDWTDGRSARAALFERGQAVASLRVRSEEPLGAVRTAGTDSDDGTYLWVEDLPGNGAAVRAFVKRYSAEGAPSAICAIPVESFFTHPVRPVRVTDDGDMYLLIPGDVRISVVRAQWVSDLDEALPPAETADADGVSALLDEDGAVAAGALDRLTSAARGLFSIEPAVASWTRVNANDRAWSYVRHRWYCNSRNFATRNGSIRPRYITSANRHYTAVPYCWGGFNTISSFNSAMSAGHSAGDINCTGGKRAGTAGVDCSGFVSRLWGQGTKRSTYTLRDVARPVSKSSMRLGDAYIWPGRHCMFFRYYTSGGAQVFESTTTNRYDRVVTMNRTNSALANYGAWRYRNW